MTLMIRSKTALSVGHPMRTSWWDIMASCNLTKGMHVFIMHAGRVCGETLLPSPNTGGWQVETMPQRRRPLLAASPRPLVRDSWRMTLNRDVHPNFRSSQDEENDAGGRQPIKSLTPVATPRTLVDRLLSNSCGIFRECLDARWRMEPSIERSVLLESHATQTTRSGRATG